MRRFPTILILAALALGLGLPPLASAGDNDIDKVNGSVQVAAGQQAGDVSTVNGAVHVGDGASVHEASTVNGEVELGDKAQATELGTVNGAISLGGGSRVSGKVNAVNGSIRLARGAEIGGRLENVNGAIVLDGAHVAGGIGTVGGDVTVGADSRVEGGILVNEDHSWFRIGSSHKPHIVIGPHAVVQGTLQFKREVELYVSDSATVGKIEGASPQKFSGDSP